MTNLRQKGSVGILVAVLLVVALVGAAAAFWYVNNTKHAVPPTTSEAKTVAKPKDPLEKDLNAINITDLEGDFKDVDKDINQL